VLVDGRQSLIIGSDGLGTPKFRDLALLFKFDPTQNRVLSPHRVPLGSQPEDDLGICAIEYNIIRVGIDGLPKLSPGDRQFGRGSIRPPPSHRQELIRLLQVGQWVSPERSGAKRGNARHRRITPA
jgi:hypothetical protein